MRVRTLEIRWHDSQPIYACDFQPLTSTQLKKVLSPRISKDTSPAAIAQITGQSYKLATGGSDNNVRVWMVYPNVLPPSALASSAQPTATPHPPRVEYLSTLSKHTAVVNVVRFSPNGEFIASAGDDGIIILWVLSDRPSHSYGSDLSQEELQHEKEHWKARLVVRCTTREVYDLAWSPNGEHIVAGSTDNTARIFSSADGACVREITEHSHYVQGVAWDPLNEFIATQSSDRSVHVYSINTKRGPFEVHAVGKNTKMTVRHSRTPSATPSSSSHRAQYGRRSSAASDTGSTSASVSERRDREEQTPLLTGNSELPLTPASVASTPAAMQPPKDHRPSSRRSSFSSNAAASPTQSLRFGRSPSPMPPLPAIRAPPATAAWASVKLYGDESFTNFFRRLTFSPDGALLLTPAGHFEDPNIVPRSSSSGSIATDDPPIRPKKPSSGSTESSSVFIYSRANFSKPPVAHLPAHKTASVAVKFSPVLYELRPGVAGAPSNPPKAVQIQPGKSHVVNIDIGVAPKDDTAAPSQSPSQSSQRTPQSPSIPLASPSSSAADLKSQSPASTSGSVFALPYRMLFAVATQDTVVIYDTQQSGPVCLFTNLHYTSFTDVSWTPDGQSLMLASSDGYCSIVVFDELLPLYHTQQHNLQLQTIAQSHAVMTPQPPPSPSLPFIAPSPKSPVVDLSSTPSSTQKRVERPISPPASVDGRATTSRAENATSSSPSGAPKKKKRRIELTHHGVDP